MDWKIFSISTRWFLFFSLFSIQFKAIANESSSFNDDQMLIYKNIVKSVSDDGSFVMLDNGMSFIIDWWYRSVSKKWSEGKQIYTFYDFEYEQCKLEDPVSGAIAWGELEDFPLFFNTIKSIPNKIGDQDAYSKIILDNGYCFRSIEDYVFALWKVENPVAILANSNGLYQIWNFIQREIALCSLVGNTKQLSRDPVKIKDIFSLEDRLNSKVLQQTEATKALTHSLLIYQAGLKDKEKPIGAFLFLGPTGVGKTELAKVLSLEIYNDPLSMLRLDMSHFTESHTISRLIGSPPGYVNHEEGGQLTNPLKQNPQRIVLLDELEKANPQVIKVFLPIFDEGFILDVKNNRIACSDTIFIMTSNLCGQEIAQLYNSGHSTEAILEKIEPKLMEILSPEIYNRVQPILFKPLAKKTMNSLVELMLNNVKEKVAVEKKIQLHFDDSLKKFLIKEGYHPLLGARPLKKLIDRKVLVALANHFIKEIFEEGSSILLIYDKPSDSVKCMPKSKQLSPKGESFIVRP